VIEVGENCRSNANGYFIMPTIITDLGDDSKLMCEEIFGPVVCIVPFDNEDEVIQRANNTAYGLCASVWTENVGRAHRLGRELEVNQI